MPFEGTKTVYRTIDGSGLLLQSVEEEEGVTVHPTVPIDIDDINNFYVEPTFDLPTIRNLLANRVLPDVMEKWLSTLAGAKERTMWSEKKFLE